MAVARKILKDIKCGQSENGLAYFLYWQDGNVINQGVLTKLNRDKTGIGTLFSFLTGCDTDTINVTRAYLESCTFYDSDYQMRCDYENHERNKSEQP